MKHYAITVNGQTYQVQVEEIAASSQVPVSVPMMSTQAIPNPVSTAAAPMNAPDPSQAQASTPANASGAKGSVEVLSPMPGKILGIKANVGQHVKAGDSIVILEAMKMENEIVAPSDGVIASINVSNGDSVEASQLLATLH